MCFSFRKLDQAQQDASGLERCARMQQCGNRIHHHDGGIDLPDDLVNFDKMHFKAKRRGPGSMKVQQPFVDPTPQFDPYRPHVMRTIWLGGPSSEGEEHAFLPASAGGVDEMRALRLVFPVPDVPDTRVLLP